MTNGDERAHLWPEPVVCAQCSHELHVCIRYSCECDRKGRPE